MEANDYRPLWDFFGLGHPAPVVGARFVTLELPEDTPAPISGAGKPPEMRCVFYSEFKAAYYVRVRHKGKELSRSFFATPEEAMVVRDRLEREIGKVA